MLSALSEAITSSGVPICTSKAVMRSARDWPADDMSHRDEMIDDATQADVGKSQRFRAVVGDEQSARAQNARLTPGRQRGQIGVDNRMLQITE